MRLWISSWIRPRRRWPVIMLEQHADPVVLVYAAFLRLDVDQRAQLLRRVDSGWGEALSPPPTPRWHLAIALALIAVLIMLSAGLRGP